MSEVYVNEPPLKGKVILHTSLGDIEIELWSKECPKTCRNFVQLCLEGYYDNCIFHRVIKDFLVQTGDPTGTGTGGYDTIYGDHYPDEHHSRLKYRYRGLVGVANLGKRTNTNGNQFFITLDRADQLNNDCTLFGKVVGNTIYNVMRIGNVETNSKDRPLNPPYIKNAEVILNPFDDIVVRKLQTIDEQISEDTVDATKDSLKKRKLNLLSFEDDNFEEIDESMRKISCKSAHDLLHDPHLLMSTAYDIDDNKDTYDDKIDETSTESLKNKLRSKIAEINKSKVVQDNGENVYECDSGVEIADENPQLDSKKLKELERKNEINKLKKDILNLRKGTGSLQKTESIKSRFEDGELMSEYEKNRQMYLLRKRDSLRRKKEQDMFKMLEDFNRRLHSIVEQGESMKLNDNTNSMDVQSNAQPISSLANLDEVIDASDKSWLYGGGLRFSIDSNRAYEIDASRDTLEVYDPLAGDRRNEEMRKLKNDRMKPSMKRNEAPVEW